MESKIKLEDKYDVTFRGPVAREVLSDIVFRTCRYGSTLDPNDVGQVAQYNVAVDILSMCGIFPTQLLGPISPKQKETASMSGDSSGS